MISASRRRRTRLAPIFVAALAALLLAGCTAGGSGAPISSSNVSSDAPASDVTRLVSIGQGRVISLECKGSGSPTVVFISGTGGAADEWMSVVDPANPQASPALSASSVFDVVARDTRVCAYDRPGTTLDSGAPVDSTPVPQPTTAQDGVADLGELLAAADEHGPYILVGASWGGMIAQLYARTDPQASSGLVLVDSASAFLKDTLSATQWANWMTLIQTAHTTPAAEQPDYDSSIAELAAAPVMPPMPTTVISSDQAWDLGVTPGISTWPAWLAAQAQLSDSLHATHVSDTHSGHGVAVEQPALVAREIAAIVQSARSQNASTPSASLRVG